MGNSKHYDLYGSVGFFIKIRRHHPVTYCCWESLKKEMRMSDVANDIYPLTVEEYESVEVIAEDVEVE